MYARPITKYPFVVPRQTTNIISLGMETVLLWFYYIHTFHIPFFIIDRISATRNIVRIQEFQLSINLPPHTHTLTQKHTHAYTNQLTYIHMRTRAHTRARERIYVFICICISVNMCVNMSECVCVLLIIYCVAKIGKLSVFCWQLSAKKWLVVDTKSSRKIWLKGTAADFYLTWQYYN